jgi:hypothetical protein
MTAEALTVAEAERIVREHIRRDPRILGPLYRYVLRNSPWEWLYAIQAGKDGPIKIGVTSGRPRDRLKTLQCGNPEELRGIAAWRAMPGEEKYLHETFAYVRIRGEWFRPVPELVDHVLLAGADFCDWTPLTPEEKADFERDVL